MWRRSNRRYQPAILIVIVGTWWWASTSQAAEEGAGQHLLLPLGEDAAAMLTERPYRARDFAAAARLGGPPDDFRAQSKRRPKLDLSPLIDGVLGFFRRHGIPLEEQRDEKGRGPIGVYADFSVGKDLPAVSFHLGDRPIEPLGAFYSADRGFRCALVWPVHRFTLRIEGGEDSEFGYYGIAGVQWIHPTRPLAAGIGIPMNLNNADGDIGVIFQFRMTLD